jgi:hypothetical protein
MSQAAKKRGKPWGGKESLSETHKQKISEALKGRKKTQEHIDNFKSSVKGRKAPNKGVPHTEETRKKISEALKGKTPWNKGLKNEQ